MCEYVGMQIFGYMSKWKQRDLGMQIFKYVNKMRGKGKENSVAEVRTCVLKIRTRCSCLQHKMFRTFAPYVRVIHTIRNGIEWFIRS